MHISIKNLQNFPKNVVKDLAVKKLFIATITLKLIHANACLLVYVYPGSYAYVRSYTLYDYSIYPYYYAEE